MKDSFGGAFMIKLMLVFIVIYITFMGVAINYAKVFRVKNNVINILEQYQFNISDDNERSTMSRVIDDYLMNVPYNIGEASKRSVKSDCGGLELGASNNEKMLTSRGVCIQKSSVSGSSNVYYKVTAYIAIDFPFFGLSFTFPISGETKTISY